MMKANRLSKHVGYMVIMIVFQSILIVLCAPAETLEKRLRDAIDPRYYSVADLISKTTSGKSIDRRTAISDLADMGPAAVEAIPALLDCLRDPDILVRISTIIALKHIDPKNEGVIAALLEVLPEKDLRIRCLALETLAEGGDKALAALEDIEPYRYSEHLSTRVTAEYASLKIRALAGSENLDFSRLLNEFDTARSYYPRQVIRALGQLAPYSKECIPYLIKALDNANVECAIDAAAALAEFGGASNGALPKIEELLNRVRAASSPDSGIGVFRNNQYKILVLIQAKQRIESDDYLRATARSQIPAATKGDK